MLYVISDEMIPETHSHGYEKQATFALIAGFLLILIFQKLLGVRTMCPSSAYAPSGSFIGNHSFQRLCFNEGRSAFPGF